MKRRITAALLALTAVCAAFAVGPDHNPVTVGSTLPHNYGGLTIDGAFGNPALVGLDIRPLHGLSVLPTSVALWSDKLAPPFNRYLLVNPNNFRRSAALYLTSYLEESFGVNEHMDPSLVSEILTRELTGGLTVYGGFQFAPFAFATRGLGVNLRTYANVDARIPDGLLLPLFSETNAFTAGSRFDVSDFSINAIWATELSVKLGTAADVPFARDVLRLDRGAAGIGAKLILGHSYFEGKVTENGVMEYDSTANKYRINAEAEVISVGTGIHGDYRYNESYLLDYPVSGYGFGFDLGAAFHNGKRFLSLDLRDIGMILWDGKQVHRQTLVFDRELDMYDLSESFSDLFGLDTLVPTGKGHVTWLPLSFNMGYSRHFDLSAVDEIHFLIGYASVGASLRQQIVLGPGRNTYMPRVTAGGTLGMLDGYLPVRYGLILGGPEKLASAIGIGLDLKYASFDFSYKAIGSPILSTVNGFEAAAAGTFRWGWKERERRPRETPPDPEPVEEPPPPEPQEEGDIAQEEAIEEAEEIAEIEEAAEDAMPPVEIELTILPPEPQPAPEPQPQPTVEERRELNTSQRAINFRSGSAELAESSFGALGQIAELLRQYPHIRYEIQGHTDSYGGDLNNMLLSAQRALTVKSYLVSIGAPEASLIAIGYGRHNPVADNGTVAGRAQNRRVEFVQIESQERYDLLKGLETETIRNMTRQVFEGRR